MLHERRTAAVLLVALWAACFEAKDLPPAPGGETNFLRNCDGQCEDGLSCVCGVCTRKCTGDRGCSSLGSNAVCTGKDAIGDTRSCEAQERQEAPAVCDARCIDDRECSHGFSCQAGLCREKPKPVAVEDAGSIAPDLGLPADAPLVMLLVDTSGSMADMPGCTCASATDCTNCQPNCAAAEQNRWYSILAALTGSYANFGCEARPRSGEIGTTYDEPYSIPDYVLASTTSQRDDGLIDAFGARLQFGLATFDSEYTYRGESDSITLSDFDVEQSEGMLGMWSYAGVPPGGQRIRDDGTAVGRVFYPGMTEPAYVDTGIRSPKAEEGALTLPSFEAPRSQRSQQLREQLSAVRPYGGTPTAAALDDLYYFFNRDPAGLAIGAARKRHVIVVTDGISDADFRQLGCACATRTECRGADPSQMSCPYPTALDATRHLRCGFDASRCSGAIDTLHVLAFMPETDANHETLDAIAAMGGSDRARFVNSQAELRNAMRSVLDGLLVGH